MKHLRIMLIPLSLALLCSFGSEELQAKNKWKPANVELQDCSMVRLTYTAYEAGRKTSSGRTYYWQPSSGVSSVSKF